MRNPKKYLTMPIVGAVVFAAVACLDDGEDGHEEHEVDCGELGSAHGDHCDCHEGALFDGETCVTPESITEVCEEHEEEEEEGAHGACVCPEAGDCPCDGACSGR